MANEKTNVMRILDKAKIAYTPHYYSHDDNAIDGISVAHKLNQPVNMVYKTLVTQGASKEFYVFVIPVDKELHLKNAAKAVKEKSIEMIKVADINKITGYIRGGCSPIGMKKQFSTTFHSDVESLTAVIVSAGKIGTQIELEPHSLINAVKGQTADLVL